MDSAGFQLVYDIHQAGCRVWFIAPVGLLLTLVSIVVWRSARAADRTGPGGPIIFFSLLTLISFVVTWGEYWHLLRAVDRGEAQVLVGVVSALEPPRSYKGAERFRVAGHVFSYSRYQTKQGFHTLSADGGPILPGVCVRLQYIDDHILRLETAARCPAG
jgi:hypothetical protein